MHKINLVWIFLLILPNAIADTADIPVLTGTGQYKFLGGWYEPDGATIPAGGTQFMPLFGDSAPRNLETDVMVAAPFNYTVSNLTLVSNLAGCGGLTGGATMTTTLRKNQVDTALSIVCTSATAAGAILVDSDIVTIMKGDRLSFSTTQTGIIGVSMRVGISLEAYRNMTITTMEVLDMTNEILDAMLVFLPFILGTVLLFAGEKRRDNIYKIGAGLMFLWGAMAVPMDNLIRIVPIGMGLWMIAHFFLAGETRGKTDV